MIHDSCLTNLTPYKKKPQTMISPKPIYGNQTPTLIYLKKENWNTHLPVIPVAQKDDVVFILWLKKSLKDKHVKDYHDMTVHNET